MPAQAKFVRSEKTKRIFDALDDGTPSFNTIVEREMALVAKCPRYQTRLAITGVNQNLVMENNSFWKLVRACNKLLS